jgi:hypothetical protein
LFFGSPIGVAPVGNAVDCDRIVGFLEKYAGIADAQPEEALELSGQRLDATGSGIGVAVDGVKDVQRNMLRDGANLRRNFRREVDLLHG